MLRLSLLLVIMVTVASTDAIRMKRQDDDSDWKETFIFLRKQLSYGELFIKGGVGNNTDCRQEDDPDYDPCAIPINHLDLEMDDTTIDRDDFAYGDNFLTWGENEYDQLREAKGTPGQVTTNRPDAEFYSKFNKYGDDFWLVRVKMDCSKLTDDFFDLKGFVDGEWENDIPTEACNGTGAIAPFYTSTNHIARCGYINVFEWDSPSCTIDEI